MSGDGPEEFWREQTAQLKEFFRQEGLVRDRLFREVMKQMGVLHTQMDANTRTAQETARIVEKLTHEVQDMRDENRAQSEGQFKLADAIERLSEKIDGLGENLGAKIDHLGEKIDHLGENLGEKIDHLGENLGEKIDRLGEKIDGLGESPGPAAA